MWTGRRVRPNERAKEAGCLDLLFLLRGRLYLNGDFIAIVRHVGESVGGEVGVGEVR